MPMQSQFQNPTPNVHPPQHQNMSQAMPVSQPIYNQSAPVNHQHQPQKPVSQQQNYTPVPITNPYSTQPVANQTYTAPTNSFGSKKLEKIEEDPFDKNNPFADDPEEEEQKLPPIQANIKQKAKEDLSTMAGNISYPTQNNNNSGASTFF